MVNKKKAPETLPTPFMLGQSAFVTGSRRTENPYFIVDECAASEWSLGWDKSHTEYYAAVEVAEITPCSPAYYAEREAARIAYYNKSASNGAKKSVESRRRDKDGD